MASVAYNLDSTEVEWRDQQLFFLSRGYLLPYRYRVDWKPSWKENKLPSVFLHEDATIGFQGKSAVVMRAHRIYDKKPVVLKKIATVTSELRLTSLLCEEPLASHPHNRCPPVVDVILHGDTDEHVYLVLPQLHDIESPFFETPAEILHCFRRYLQGLAFLHEQNIAHKDIHLHNAMMDPGTMFPKGYHVIYQEYYADDPINGPSRLRRAPYTSRSLSDLKYYFIDLGSAKQYPQGPDAGPPLASGVQGHYMGAPELRWDRPYNPMWLDMIALGAMFLRVVEDYEGWDDANIILWLNTFLNPVPERRPDAHQALSECEKIIREFPRAELEKRIRPKEGRDEGRPFASIYYTIRAVFQGQGGTLKRELFEDLDTTEPKKHTKPEKTTKSLPLRLFATFRYLLT